MELHYSYEDIEPYEGRRGPRGDDARHRQQLGFPPPIPLAEPWELGPPVPVLDKVSWPAPSTRVGEVDVDDDEDDSGLWRTRWPT